MGRFRMASLEDADAAPPARRAAAEGKATAGGPSSQNPVFAPRSVRRPLFTLQVHPVSLCRCGKSN